MAASIATYRRELLAISEIDEADVVAIGACGTADEIRALLDVICARKKTQVIGALQRVNFAMQQSRPN